MHCIRSINCRFSVLVLLWVAALAPLAGWADNRRSSRPQNIVVPVTVTRGLTGVIPIGGKVAARRSVVLAAQLPGRIVSISGEEGDFFQQGAVLLRLDNRELLAQRRSAVAQWASASVALHNTAVQHNQALISPSATRRTPGGMGMPDMFDQIFIDPMADILGTRSPDAERGAELFSSRTRIDTATHALEQARSSIEQIDTKLRDSQSMAPFDGVIVDKFVEAGDTVQPGQLLLGFEDVSDLQIVVDVPARLAHTLNEDDRLTARIDANNIITAVQVDNIFPKTDPTKHTVRIKFNLPTTINVAAGTYAEVFIPNVHEQKNAVLITVPGSAIAQRGGLPVVFVVDDSNKVGMRLVRLGGQLPSGQTVIEYGLSGGDLIVDKPASYLISGKKLPAAK